MDTVSGGLAGSRTALAAALGAALAGMAPAGCAVQRSLLPHDTLVQDDRGFDERPDVTWFSLNNGLRVALAPDDRANLVSVDVRYLVGAAEDPPGKSGLAHLVEHMLFDQRTEPGGPTLGDRLHLVALDANASTTWDATHFREVALAPDLDQLLEIEATRLSAGCQGIDQPEFDREVAVVAQEINLRGVDELGEALRGQLFGAGHAYARSVGGTDLAKLTLDDVCRFVEAHYGPERALLIIGGKIDRTALPRAIARRFGPLDRRAIGEPAPIAPIALGGGLTELHVPAAAAHAMVLFPAAPWGSPEAIEDQLLDELMMQELVLLEDRVPWIAGVDKGYLGGVRAGVRFFAVTVRDPARLGDATTVVIRAVEKLARSDFSGPLARLVARRHTQLLDNLESFVDRGGQCADSLQFAGDKYCRLRELHSLQEVHAGRVRERARARLLAASRVVRVLPKRGGAPTARVPLSELSPEIDAPVWRAVVDPAEAGRTIALPVERRLAEVSDFRLPNGLRVLMAGNFTQPVVEARLVFPVGRTSARASDDLVAHAAAQLIEHDFVSKYSREDIATIRWVLGLGAQLSAEVTDHTTFRIRGSAAFADWHLWRLSWLVQEGIYAGGDLRRVRDAAARREQGARLHDHGQSWRRALREALFGRDHPYARDPDLVADTAALSVGALEAFRDTYYRASGATLIIAGNFDPVAMRRTVIQLFGTWSTAAPPPRGAAIPAMQPAPGPTWIAHADPEATQVRITFGFAATSPRVPSRAARAVAAEMVRNRLELVRTQLGASYGVEAGYDLTPAGDVFQVDGRVAASRAGEVVRRMVADLASLHTGDGAFAGDFVRARRAVLAGALADPARASATARRLENAVVNHLALTDGELYPAAVAATTLAEVNRVIAEDLQPARMVGVLSGRPADTTAALTSAGITGARTISDGAAKR